MSSVTAAPVLRPKVRFFLFCAALVLLSQGRAGAAPQPPFAISASEVGVPEGVAMGAFQRTIRPFGNWTLVCDDDLSRNSTVCNVRQTVSDSAGSLVFSWALALTQEGRPFMLLRTAPMADPEANVSIRFEGRSEPVEVRFDGCNDVVCVAVLPVGPIMRSEIARNAAPTVAYRTRDGATITVQPTLEGLSDVLDELE